MNAADARRHHNSIGLRRNNGINEFITVLSRATFAVPARAQRVYPGHAIRRSQADSSTCR
jgi:hypothetical protein